MNEMLTDPDQLESWHGDEEDGRMKKTKHSEFGDNCLTCGLYIASCEPSKISYTTEDLERARAEERARCEAKRRADIIAWIHDAQTEEEEEVLKAYLNIPKYSMTSLGPVGETREETERRVRRETIKEIKKAWDDAHDRHPTLGVFEEDARYVYPGRIEDFEKALDAIAEGRNL